MRFGIVSLVAISILAAVLPIQYDYYPPAIWQGHGPEMPAFRNVRDYGAVGDGITDDWQAIQKVINFGPGIVYFPPGEYAISETLVVSRDSLILQGSGGGWIYYLYGYPDEEKVGSSLVWIGEVGGTMLKIGDGVEPNSGCAIKDMALDGNQRATTLLMADATFYLRVDNLMGYQWRDGFAVVITHTAGVRGAGEKYHTWDHITLLNPYKNGSGIDIAPEGSWNVNQITITSCQVARSNVDDWHLTSLRLGYVDHIAFNRCSFVTSAPAYQWQDYERYNPYAITVQPIEDHHYFPVNITFYGTSLYGGINYVDNMALRSNGHSSLLFYPFYTADGQVVPPSGYINGEPATLPSDFVGGFTDLGGSLD